ncbi:hypothetical protein SLE2022_318600 [Rubroshorea leprosula]
MSWPVSVAFDGLLAFHSYHDSLEFLTFCFADWPPFASIVHNDILIYLEKSMYIAFSSFLGILVLCFFWNVTAATAAYIKGEGWKPGGNETASVNTCTIQEASYWGIGSSLAIMEIVCNILQELKINNHHNFEHYSIVRRLGRCSYLFMVNGRANSWQRIEILS